MKKHLLLTLGLALASPLLLAQNSGSTGSEDDKDSKAATPAVPAIPASPSGSGDTAVDGPRRTENGGTSGSAKSGDKSAGATGNPSDQSAKTRTKGGSLNTQFGSLDVNGDNKISQDELKVNTGLSARFKEADSNSDGNLSRGEFSKLEDSAKESGGKDKTTEPRTEGSDRTDKDDDLNRRLGGG
jgi:hypothetical protein